MIQQGLIETAIKEAKAKGVLIVRGPCFWWTGQGHETDALPKACSAYGAVLMHLGLWLEPGSLRAVCEHLNVSPQWIYRFSIGFDNQHQLFINAAKKDTDKPIWVADEVCKMGLSLSKKYVEVHLDGTLV